MISDSTLTVEDRARKAIGNIWWWREDGEGGHKTVAMSFEEICDAIREFDRVPEGSQSPRNAKESPQ